MQSHILSLSLNVGLTLRVVIYYYCINIHRDVKGIMELFFCCTERLVDRYTICFLV